MSSATTRGRARPFEPRAFDYLDLLSFADVSAGALAHYFTSVDTLGRERAEIKEGGNEVLRWLCHDSVTLKKLCVVVQPTQTTFSPRYPIELTPAGPQSIPRTSGGSSSSVGGFRAPRRSVVRRSPRPRAASFGASNGPTYVYRCSVCGKRFNKKTYDATLNPHKNSKTGFQCYGTYGVYETTKY